jgi:hypothetical protein
MGGIGPLIACDMQVVSPVILAHNTVDKRIENDFAKECAEHGQDPKWSFECGYRGGIVFTKPLIKTLLC